MLTFNYDSAVSPLISSILPVHGLSGLTTIIGSGFGTNSGKIRTLINKTNSFLKY